MVDQNILVEMEWNQNCTILTFNKFPGQLDLTSTHAPQAVDDGVLQPLLGDLVCENNAENPSVFGVIGSNHGNRIHVGYQDQNMKIRLQGEKKKQES